VEGKGSQQSLMKSHANVDQIMNEAKWLRFDESENKGKVLTALGSIQNGRNIGVEHNMDSQHCHQHGWGQGRDHGDVKGKRFNRSRMYTIKLPSV